MANQNARIKRSYQGITGQVTVSPYILSAKQISDWVQSINSANNQFMPNRRRLYELYERVELDAQIETVTNLRTIAITNKKIRFSKPGTEGKEDEGLMHQLHSPWFSKMVRHAIAAKWWGHSLIEFEVSAGIITDTILVPRMNVMPEKGLALYQSTNMTSGIDYRMPPVSNYVFEVQGDKKLGLYSLLVPYVLYKAGGLGDWSQFCELFGLPFREFNYNPFDPESRNRVEEAAKAAGAAGWIILPDGSSVKIHDTNKTGSKDVFEGLIKVCDEQIAKAVLGGTMITDNGSSQAQASVHYDVKNEINLSDLIWMEYVLNWEAKPRLINLGLPLDGGDLRFDNTREIPLEKRIEMDVQLAEQVPIGEEYWYKTYGVPQPKGKAKPNTGKKDKGNGGDPSAKKQ